MATKIKAVVFRTSQLKTTKDFFATKLGFVIKESSVTHFVIHSKGIRLLFVESNNDVEAELYMSSKLEQHITKTQTLTERRDPNGIKIIISDYHYESSTSIKKS